MWDEKGDTSLHYMAAIGWSDKIGDKVSEKNGDKVSEKTGIKCQQKKLGYQVVFLYLKERLHCFFNIIILTISSVYKIGRHRTVLPDIRITYLAEYQKTFISYF